MSYDICLQFLLIILKTEIDEIAEFCQYMKNYKHTYKMLHIIRDVTEISHKIAEIIFKS